MGKMLFPEESFRIIGACFAVYNEIGHSFTEAIYHECLEIEFSHLGIPFLSKAPLTIRYRGQPLRQTFEPDFLCFEKIVLEIKATKSLVDDFRAQIVNYIHAANYDLGLLVNFGAHPNLQNERFVHSRFLPSESPASFRP